HSSHAQCSSLLLTQPSADSGSCVASSESEMTGKRRQHLRNFTQPHLACSMQNNIRKHFSSVRVGTKGFIKMVVPPKILEQIVIPASCSL
ncbi:Oxysterol-binding protein 7, partial [Dissostichus eleginoides]